MDFIRPTSGHASLAGDSGMFRAVTERRDGSRMTAAGSLLMAWHHQHEEPQEYPALDVSENGARIEISCMLPEGLTGIALAHRPSGVRIQRPAMVVWCRAVRDGRGLLRHYEAGIRFF